MSIAQKKGDALVVAKDEHPRETSMEALAKLKGVVRPDGTVTAGNASGVNDGACALLLASEAAAARHGLKPRARVVGMATAGVAPRIMGFGPAPAVRKVLALTGLTLKQMDVIELNEAFAAQGLAVLRDLGLADDDARVNPNGGAIALGHPLGASGARLATTAVNQLHTHRRALRAVHHVHRRGPGHRAGDRTGVGALRRLSGQTRENRKDPRRRRPDPPGSAARVRRTTRRPGGCRAASAPPRLRLCPSSSSHGMWAASRPVFLPMSVTATSTSMPGVLAGQLCAAPGGSRWAIAPVAGADAHPRRLALGLAAALGDQVSSRSASSRRARFGQHRARRWSGRHAPGWRSSKGTPKRLSSSATCWVTVGWRQVQRARGRGKRATLGHRQQRAQAVQVEFAHVESHS